MKIKFLSPVNAGTEVYSQGDTADMPPAQAKELITCGAAEHHAVAAGRGAAKAEADAKELAEKEAAELPAKQQAQS